MNFHLPFMPERATKNRTSGLTMVMDKGLSIIEAENLTSSCAEHIDLVKFGFGTALVSKGIKEKISVYKNANIRTYLGGTLFELFLVRNMFDEFRRYVDQFQLDLVEVSDGSIFIPHDEKLNYIRILSKQVTVLSEVGSKQAGVLIPHEKWIGMMQAELQAGSWKVIAEARESGNIGIYNSDGSANINLINDIIEKIDTNNIIWESPVKSQQVWFIKLLGANVNLGNIAPFDVIPLETIRMGLRGDTFFQFLPKEISEKFKIKE